MLFLYFVFDLSLVVEEARQVNVAIGIGMGMEIPSNQELQVVMAGKAYGQQSRRVIFMVAVVQW